MELVCESQINGYFYGMDGFSVYTLTNGQIYKQSRIKTHYHYSYYPRAKVWKEDSQYLLDVDGMDVMIEVDRII